MLAEGKAGYLFDPSAKSQSAEALAYSAGMATSTPYLPRRPSRSRFVEARGLRQHLLEWGDADLTRDDRPTIVMLHGWMDVAASFQFVVDAFVEDRHVLALDWRGFGGSDTPAADTYFFPESVGDLELVLMIRSQPGPESACARSWPSFSIAMYSWVPANELDRAW